ncbi:hypothetical protein K5E40_20385 [Pseudomonas baetica]|uniref:hypothetical protein n=1 Tax=Pseudomonas TaxID=286 RepID=UPI001C8BCE38|nr:hypothetical protein [Pseudomonas baetica]MBX9408040.1 hypothetical protein [Pseudomonas baetica]
MALKMMPRMIRSAKAFNKANKLKKGFFMTSVLRPNSIKGIFLEKVEISLPRKEIMVIMNFATKQKQQDPETKLITEKLVDIKQIAAISRDNGKNFEVGPYGDMDGDGDIDRHDRAKLIALAKAYSGIVIV